MAVDDLWYLKKRGPDGERLPSKGYGRGKRYRVRFVDDTGQRKQLLFAKKADAERHDANMRADVSRGQYIDPSSGLITVAAYGKQYRESRLHRVLSAERVEREFRLHINPMLGTLPMAQVRPSHIQSWVKARAAEMEPSSLRTIYSSLAAMFNTAVLDRVIGTTPCRNIRLPDVPGADMFIPTAEQIHALASNLEPRYRALPYVAAGTGLRQGEVWGLELEHVDFLRRKMSVTQQLLTSMGQEPYLAPVKTATSKRSAEIGQVVTEAIAEHIRNFPLVDVEIEDRTDPRKPFTRTAKLLFTNDRGNPIRRSSWSYQWQRAVKAAGLPGGFGFHGLRHYFATLLIQGGASVKTVQLALGHANPTITLNTYLGHWPDAIEATRTLVDNALGEFRVPVLRSVGKIH